MKNITIKWATGIMLAGTLLLSNSCTNDFAEINTDPSVVTDPDPKYLFTYSLNSLPSSGSEWIWENLEQLLRFTQHMTTDPYELSTNINSRYGNFYSNVLPNLVEIRRQIDLKADKQRYQKMRAATYVAGIFYGLHVSDMNGSIPYTQAGLGRSEGNFKPEYDGQQKLYDTWLAELNTAIADLVASSTDQLTYGNADIFYHSDWTKWVKLANSLKLRIAVRYEGQDKAKTTQIFKEVMENAVGPITADEDQFAYLDPNSNPIGGDIDYRSARYATKSIVSFLKTTNDPRLQMYFSPNDLTAANLDSIKKYKVTLPAFISATDTQIRYQGGPADWTTDAATAQYYKNPLTVGTSKLVVMSSINKVFFAPRRNGGLGTFHDYLVTSAETCFYIAELIEKGYGAGLNTKGTSEEWYKKGVASSLRTMNAIAVAALSTTGFTQSTVEAQITAYLAQTSVKFNGVNNLERIYIQEYLNFMRLPTEAFTFIRRTGYPKNSSTYYPRDKFNEPIPRRYWVDEPALGTNNENWLKSQTEQGFTPGDRTVQALSTQRLWFDKNNPVIGEGK
ncbi:SusD/RagB family nutrient-binding outer membrane lipoprotein [Dyadobacter psychrotolerans]|uniref:SusD/RagB family nutrient-binding outer membrane lipoprotein n=1 Tax=Dyadobacter psychrotolerans TaxID=2541721 RepID=A0A4R5DAV4_9BACT|nr:SusD/RagB family nutrient-binding outer membrane lipoprotein [Dyadobacter psychrotolerans]TDE09987.1 SusD/RagB family nutrient-binding outer membrane lipoprotein [Dyadobacter psychrotolerans]